MPLFVIRFWRQFAVTAWIAAALAGCADATPAEEAGHVGMRVGALAQCGGQATDPFSQIVNLEIKVRDGSSGTLKNVLKSPATAPVKAGQTAVSFQNVAAGSPREVTLLGFAKGSAVPTWFARRTGVNIKKNDTTTLDMTLMAIEGFTCVGTKAMPNALFPASVVMDNGRVLITGGYTNAVADGGQVRLESPTDRAYIFDPNTGSFKQTVGLLKEARAGHSMIYLAKPNQVLIVGGAKKMVLPADASGPPAWQATDGASLAYEIYDVASGQFIAGPGNGENCKKRVFANLMALTDDYVVAIGGAPWPFNDTDFYSKGDLYESKHSTSEQTGKFKDVGNGLQLNAVRAGAAVAYVGPTSNGTSRYLIWGGNTGAATTDKTDVLPTNLKHAERFKESTEPGTGEFFADYVLEGDFAAARNNDAPDNLNRDQALFFPTLSPLGRATKDGKEVYNFLSIGGSRFVAYGDKKHWLPPSLDDAYLVTLLEPTDTTKGRIFTKRVPGLAKGVYFHQANPAGTGAVLLTGGFSTFGGAADFSMQSYDIASGKLDASDKLEASKQFVLRGGHAGLGLRNDCVLLFGGASKLADQALSSTQAATSDVYCPRLLVPK